jgi:hypothetical protein
MCVVKAFREDRTLVAAGDYISDALGQRFVESVPLSMEVRWRGGLVVGVLAGLHNRLQDD